MASPIPFKLTSLIGVTKRHDAWITEYGVGAQDSKTWITNKVSELQNVAPGVDGFVLE